MKGDVGEKNVAKVCSESIGCPGVHMRLICLIIPRFLKLIYLTAIWSATLAVNSSVVEVYLCV